VGGKGRGGGGGERWRGVIYYRYNGVGCIGLIDRGGEENGRSVRGPARGTAEAARARHGPQRVIGVRVLLAPPPASCALWGTTRSMMMLPRA